MPQKNQTQKSSTRLTTGGFANIAVFIIFLLTMGGTVVYFKNFPLEKLPAGEQQMTQTKEVVTNETNPDVVLPPTIVPPATTTPTVSATTVNVSQSKTSVPKKSAASVSSTGNTGVTKFPTVNTLTSDKTIYSSGEVAKFKAVIFGNALEKFIGLTDSYDRHAECNPVKVATPSSHFECNWEMKLFASSTETINFKVAGIADDELIDARLSVTVNVPGSIPVKKTTPSIKLSTEKANYFSGDTIKFKAIIYGDERENIFLTDGGNINMPCAPEKVVVPDVHYECKWEKSTLATALGGKGFKAIAILNHEVMASDLYVIIKAPATEVLKKIYYTGDELVPLIVGHTNKTHDWNLVGVYSSGVERAIGGSENGTTYVSKNPGIATVDKEGVVTAGKIEGIAEIVATNNGLSATFEVDVYKTSLD